LLLTPAEKLSSLMYPPPCALGSVGPSMVGSFFQKGTRK
jgi:hypothetical protein